MKLVTTDCPPLLCLTPPTRLQTRCSTTPLRMSGLTPMSHRACTACHPPTPGTRSPASPRAWPRRPQAPTSWLPVRVRPPLLCLRPSGQRGEVFLCLLQVAAVEQGVRLVRGTRGRWAVIFSSTRLISPCSSTTNSNSSNSFTTTSSSSFCSTNNRSVRYGRSVGTCSQFLVLTAAGTLQVSTQYEEKKSCLKCLYLKTSGSK